jgi:hypothetical protein
MHTASVFEVSRFLTKNGVHPIQGDNRMKTLATLALGCVFAAGAFAQAWPLKPVRIVVPAPPGSSLDIIARTLGDKLKDRWKQPVTCCRSSSRRRSRTCWRSMRARRSRRCPSSSPGRRSRAAS